MGGSLAPLPPWVSSASSLVVNCVPPQAATAAINKETESFFTRSSRGVSKAPRSLRFSAGKRHPADGGSERVEERQQRLAVIGGEPVVLVARLRSLAVVGADGLVQRGGPSIV